MKKFFKVVSSLLIVVLILLLLVFVGAFIFLKNLDVKKYKPQIIQAASQSLGRKVDFKDIDLKISWDKGVRFHLTDFSIAEDSKFGMGSFVIIPEIDAGIDIAQFIISRQISVPGILVGSARVNIIRDNKGNWNVLTIGSAASSTSSQQAPSKEPALLPMAAMPAVFINSIKIENARIEFIDQSVTPELKLAISQATLDINKFSLTNPFDISFQAAVLSPEINVRVYSKAQLKLLKKEARIFDAQVLVDLGHLPLDLLKSLLLPVGVPFPQTLNGQLKGEIKECVFSEKGVGDLDAGISLINGNVMIPDVIPGISLAVSHINANIRDFHLEEPFGFDIQMAILSSVPNIDLKGEVALDLEDQQVSLKDVTVHTDLSLLSMDKLKTSVAALKDISLPERLKGNLSIAVEQAVVVPQGLLALSADGYLKDWEVKFKELAVPIIGVDMNFQLTEGLFSIDTLKAALGKGEIKAKVDVTDYMTQQDFDFSAKMEGVDLAEILEQKDAPIKVEGLILGDIKVKGQAIDPNSIKGSGNFEVKDAKLKDFNVLKTVLDQLAFLPDVSTRLEKSLPDKYKEKLKDKDTRINMIKASCSIEALAAMIEPIAIESDEFIFSGKALVGFDQSYSFDGQVKITKELSKAMAEAVEEFQYLFDGDANISLPVHVTGKGAGIPVVSVEQMAIDMGKNALRNEAKKQLGDILNKVLGTDEPQEPVQSPEQGAEVPVQDQESPALEIIDDILDKVFK